MFVKVIFFVVLLFYFNVKAEPITLITPFGAGGPTDIIARHTEMSIEMNSNLNVGVINIPGASGNIGFRHFVSKQKSLLIAHDHIITNSIHLPTSYPEKIVDEAKPIFFLKGGFFIVYANSKFKNFENLKQFSQNSELIVGTSPPGSGSFLGFNLLCNEKQILKKCRPVVYSSVSSAMSDMLSNRLDFYVSLYSSHNSFTAYNSNIPLLVLSNKKFFALPEVATSSDLNLDIVIDNWAGIFHKNLSSEEIVKIQNSAKKYFTIDILNKLGYDEISFDLSFYSDKIMAHKKSLKK